MGLTSVGAYVPEHLEGQDIPVQEPFLQVESIVLLNEDGTPRCLIGQRPSEYLATLETLRECDQGDELHALTILGDEEISLGMAVPPTGDLGKAASFLNNAVRLAAPEVWKATLSLSNAVRLAAPEVWRATVSLGNAFRLATPEVWKAILASASALRTALIPPSSATKAVLASTAIGGVAACTMANLPGRTKGDHGLSDSVGKVLLILTIAAGGAIFPVALAPKIAGATTIAGFSPEFAGLLAAAGGGTLGLMVCSSTDQTETIDGS